MSLSLCLLAAKIFTTLPSSAETFHGTERIFVMNDKRTREREVSTLRDLPFFLRFSLSLSLAVQCARHSCPEGRNLSKYCIVHRLVHFSSNETFACVTRRKDIQSLSQARRRKVRGKSPCRLFLSLSRDAYSISFSSLETTRKGSSCE